MGMSARTQYFFTLESQRESVREEIDVLNGSAGRKRILHELEHEITRGSMDLPLLLLTGGCMQIPPCFSVGVLQRAFRP